MNFYISSNYEKHTSEVNMIIDKNTTLKEYQTANPYAVGWTESDWEIIKDGLLNPKFTINYEYLFGKKSLDLFIEELLMTPEELSEKYKWFRKSKNTTPGVNWNDPKLMEDCEKFFENLFNESQKENNDNKL